MKIYSVCDKQFNQFGKVIESPFHHLFEKQSLNIPMPESGLKYMASVSEFETQESMAYYRKAFGEVDIQIGYCWGENKMLNGLEWHNCIEINCALEDMILMLADLRDMVNDTINSKHVKAFLVKKGQSVQMFQTTLHFCPANVDAPFKSVVILPKGTNTPLESESDDKKLVAKNKWLICHPDCKKLVDAGRVVGILGKNLQVK